MTIYGVFLVLDATFNKWFSYVDDVVRFGGFKPEAFQTKTPTDMLQLTMITHQKRVVNLISTFNL